MSVDLHRQSQGLVMQAELATATSDAAAVRELYRRAADLEAQAYDVIPEDRPRTRSIIALSSVHLYMRAEAFDAALLRSHHYLSRPDLQDWARQELNKTVANLQVEFLRRQRRVLMLLFDRTEWPLTTVSSELIADAMTQLQGAIRWSANAQRRNVSKTARKMPRRVIEATQLGLAGLAFGSSGVVLIDAQPQPELLDEGDTLDQSIMAVMRLLEMVSQEADHPDILKAIGVLGPQSVSKIRALAERITRSEIDVVKLRWAGRDSDTSVSLSRDQVADLVEILTEAEYEIDIITVEGLLAGADRLHLQFSIETDDGNVYTGTIAETAWPRVVAIRKPFTVRCRAILEETRTTSKTGLHTAYTYRLLDIESFEN
jgi:hypothetical protein